MSILSILAAFLLISAWSPYASGASLGNIAGEIQRISVDNTTDHWSGGRIVVGGREVIIPRNLLIDLPANRVTLQQLYVDAPPACVTAGETGLAKGDVCNKTGMGAIATISANKTNGGNIIAGDVLIDKGLESVTGVVTYINYDDGYFRLDGNPGDNTTGVMVRLNDPTSRHTIQKGAGCTPESLANNCSADPRFTLDPDNYTNVFSTGYPLCIPSTSTTSPLGGSRSTGSNASGVGDPFCPVTNRTVNLGQPVDNSSFFAPVLVGDSVTAEGNYEIVNGVQFLSSHTTIVNKGLTTKTDPTQPDYLFLAEVEIDAPGFNNARVRSLFIGFTTLPSTNVTIWSLHRDPQTNVAHEFPMVDVAGCELASGGGGINCVNQGIGGGLGNHIFKVRHDVDFVQAATGAPPGGADPKLSPCAHLRAGGFDVCTQGALQGLQGGTFAEEFAILSPIPHEIIARTEHGRLPGTRNTFDINGNTATNGVYLFPLGANLGGIGFPEFVEVNLDQVATPNIFEGITWNLDRRLSPNGCLDTGCEATAQPLNPFPFSGLDPRTQAGTPTGNFNDPTYTASLLSFGRNRILSFVDGNIGNFNGNSTLVPYPPADPAPIAITPVTPVTLAFVALPPSPATGATLFASLASPQFTGASVTFIGVGSGGTGTYEYRFWLNSGGTWNVVQDYSTASTWTWNNPAAGSYQVAVWARSVGSILDQEAVSTTMPFVINSIPVQTDNVTFSASPAGSQIVGNPVFVTASAGGGSGSYEYRFWLFTGGVWTIVQDYTTAPTWTWTNPAVGSYQITVWARSVGSTADEAFGTAMSYTINPIPNPATGVTLSALPVDTQTAGQPVVFTGTGSGGTGTYEYRFWLNSGGVWTVVQDYSSSNQWTWTNPAAGSYQVSVWARSAGSTADSEATGTPMAYTVTP